MTANDHINVRRQETLEEIPSTLGFSLFCPLLKDPYDKLSPCGGIKCRGRKTLYRDCAERGEGCANALKHDTRKVFLMRFIQEYL